MKGDERILGDSEFVMTMLSEADEQMDHRYEVKGCGYAIERVG